MLFLNRIFFLLFLFSCGFNVIVESVGLEAVTYIAKSDSPSGTEVGNIVLRGKQCSSTVYSLLNDYNGLFKINNEGKISLAKDNPTAGTYKLIVLVNCSNENSQIEVVIKINERDKILIKVETIYSTSEAFAALRTDGSVITWGRNTGGGDSSAVDLSSNVVKIFSNYSTFAALKSDGAVIIWGGNAMSGNTSLSDLNNGILQIKSNIGGFAALHGDGSVATWGQNNYTQITGGIDLSSGVAEIFSTSSSFAALKNDGTLCVWGDHDVDGNSEGFVLTNNVESVIAMTSGYLVKKTDGTAMLAGNVFFNSYLGGVNYYNVKKLHQTNSSFAALMNDGSVVTWGLSQYGGDSSGVDFSGGVKAITEHNGGFAALKNDGSVLSWGYAPSTDTTGVDFSGVIEKVVAAPSRFNGGGEAFIAMKADGSAVTWGTPNYGGDSSSVSIYGLVLGFSQYEKSAQISMSLFAIGILSQLMRYPKKKENTYCSKGVN